MADEQVQDKQGAAPVVDVEALASQVGEKLRGDLASFIQQQQREPEPVHQPGPEPLRDPLGDMLRQHIAPDLAAANLKAEAAADKADFYASHADLDASERAEIEDLFNKQIKLGRPMPRADLFNWWQGKNVDKVIEKRAKAREADLNRAAAAQTVGDSAGTRTAPGPTKSAYDMTDDELGKAVTGMSF